MKEQACYMQVNEKIHHADVTGMHDLVPSLSVSLYKKKKIGTSLENTEVITLRIYILECIILLFFLTKMIQPQPI